MLGDRLKAWDAFFESGALPDNKGDCDNPIAKTAALGATLQGERHADAVVRRRLDRSGRVPAQQSKPN